MTSGKKEKGVWKLSKKPSEYPWNLGAVGCRRGGAGGFTSGGTQLDGVGGSSSVFERVGNSREFGGYRKELKSSSREFKGVGGSYRVGEGSREL
jgi:hypothetical protein